jgi:hypothetical protein
MLASVHGPIGHKGVGVIQGTAYDRVNVLLLETDAPVRILLCFWPPFGSGGESGFIHIADRNNVLSGSTLKVFVGAMASRYKSDVELVAGRISSKQLQSRQNERSGAECSGIFQELTAFE